MQPNKVSIKVRFKIYVANVSSFEFWNRKITRDQSK